MRRIRFQLPIVNIEPKTSPLSPCCGSGARIKEHRLRSVDDIRVWQVKVTRYTCKKCGRSFTVRPEGVSRSSKSDRTKALAILLYLSGASFDCVVQLVRALKVNICKSTVYNYVQQAGKEAGRLRKKLRPKTVRMVGVDTTGWRVAGKSATLHWAVDAETGMVMDVRFVHKEDAATFVKFLRKVLGPEVEVLVSDEARAYARVAEELGKGHQVCVAHFKKALNGRVKRVLAECSGGRGGGDIKQIRKDCKQILKLNGPGKKPTARLYGLAKRMHERYKHARAPGKGQRASLEYRMKLLALDLLEYVPKILTYRKYKDGQGGLILDGTNNATERAIGLTGKIRQKVMRGSKSRRSVRRLINIYTCIHNALALGHPVFRLGDLIAS
jgi:transposase-like protein